MTAYMVHEGPLDWPAYWTTMSHAVAHSITQASPSDLTRDAWRLHLTFMDYNPKNKSGISHKFWQVQSVASSPSVEVSWGPMGGRGSSMIIGVSAVAAKIKAKIKSGYTPVAVGSYYTESKPYFDRETCKQLMAKLESMGPPYNQTNEVTITPFGAKCLDKEGDFLLTISPQGVRDLLGVWAIP